jgi:hypothetical protein
MDWNFDHKMYLSKRDFRGATTFSKTTLSIKTFGIMTLSIKGLFVTLSIMALHTEYYAQDLFIIIPNVILLSNVMLSVVMPSVIMLRVVMLNVVAPFLVF